MWNVLLLFMYYAIFSPHNPQQYVGVLAQKQKVFKLH